LEKGFFLRLEGRYNQKEPSDMTSGGLKKGANGGEEKIIGGGGIKDSWQR